MRWIRTGIGMLFVGSAMCLGAIATALAGGPTSLAAVLIVLMVVFGLAGFTLALVGVGKSRAENKQMLTDMHHRQQQYDKDL